jgi:hypothetical protein
VKVCLAVFEQPLSEKYQPIDAVVRTSTARWRCGFLACMRFRNLINTYRTVYSRTVPSLSSRKSAGSSGLVARSSNSGPRPSHSKKPGSGFWLKSGETGQAQLITPMRFPGLCESTNILFSRRLYCSRQNLVMAAASGIRASTAGFCFASVSRLVHRVSDHRIISFLWGMSNIGLPSSLTSRLLGDTAWDMFPRACHQNT